MKLGAYEIVALLGSGGMGEVYRSRDTKLKREIAIKILPEEFSRNADRISCSSDIYATVPNVRLKI